RRDRIRPVPPSASDCRRTGSAGDCRRLSTYRRTATGPGSAPFTATGYPTHGVPGPAAGAPCRLLLRQNGFVAFRARAQDAAVGFGYANVVDAGLAPRHQAFRGEFPLFVAVTAPPLAGFVMPLVLEADRDAVAFERPEVLAQCVAVFDGPLAGEECDDGGAA